MIGLVDGGRSIGRVDYAGAAVENFAPRNSFGQLTDHTTIDGIHASYISQVGKLSNGWWMDPAVSNGIMLMGSGSVLQNSNIGYAAGDDLWVTPDKLRPIKPVQYAVGSNVDVLWKKKWYPATILKVEDGIHLIHYTDYDSSWDEWVASKRIRKARS